METKGSSPHSQEHATCSWLEPEQSSPCLPPYFLEICFGIILPSMFRLPSFLFLSDFPTKSMYAPLPLSMHATGPSISFFLIWPLKQYLVRSSDHKTPHYAGSFAPLTTSLLRLKIFLSTLFSDTSSLCSFSVWEAVSPLYKQDAKLFFCIFYMLDIFGCSLFKLYIFFSKTKKLGPHSCNTMLYKW